MMIKGENSDLRKYGKKLKQTFNLARKFIGRNVYRIDLFLLKCLGSIRMVSGRIFTIPR